MIYNKKSQFQHFLDYYFCDWSRGKKPGTNKRYYNWKLPFYRMWFWPLRFIQKQNWKDVKYYITVNEKGESEQSKPNPFLGMIVEIDQGAVYNFRWWKHIKYN